MVSYYLSSDLVVDQSGSSRCVHRKAYVVKHVMTFKLGSIVITYSLTTPCSKSRNWSFIGSAYEEERHTTTPRLVQTQNNYKYSYYTGTHSSISNANTPNTTIPYLHYTACSIGSTHCLVPHSRARRRYESYVFLYCVPAHYSL